MNSDLEKRLRFCRDLPTLPTVALRIIDLGNDPDVSLGDVARIIAMDPALTTKLLRVANSPVYGVRRKTDNLRQALTLLGLDAAMTLALGFSLTTTLRGGPKSAIDTDAYWHRSLLAAIAARALGAKSGLASLDELLLAGLLQDIGMLALMAMMPEEYGEIMARANNHQELIDAECAALGSDHSEVGAWLLRHWRLPEYLSLAVLGSHEPSRARAPRDLAPIVPCVAVSGMLADLYLNSNEADEINAVVRVAHSWLGIEEQGVQDVLEVVESEAPQIADMFDIELLDLQQVSGILDQSRELLVTRNLQMLKVAAETRERADRLESEARTLEEQGRRDPLTGLYNRNYLNATLEKMFTESNEQGWPLTVAFIDLDHFKSINDNYGHQAGDIVLVGVANLILGQLRKTDVVSRYGGEEFVVLLPNSGLESARRLFERLIHVIGSHWHLLGDSTTVQVTASVGVASHGQAGLRIKGVAELLKSADRALYAAKRAGRNRVSTCLDSRC